MVWNTFSLHKIPQVVLLNPQLYHTQSTYLVCTAEVALITQVIRKLIYSN